MEWIILGGFENSPFYSGLLRWMGIIPSQWWYPHIKYTCGKAQHILAATTVDYHQFLNSATSSSLDPTSSVSKHRGAAVKQSPESGGFHISCLMLRKCLGINKGIGALFLHLAFRLFLNNMFCAEMTPAFNLNWSQHPNQKIDHRYMTSTPFHWSAVWDLDSAQYQSTTVFGTIFVAALHALDWLQAIYCN